MKEGTHPEEITEDIHIEERTDTQMTIPGIQQNLLKD
jgi:hypothetical protein